MLLIDCYNLLHETMPASLAGLDEDRLCRLLARSAYASGRVVVVCDGAPKPGLAMTSPVDEVELVYSGKGRSADDVILGLIEQNTTPRRLEVVSSDRQIQKAARRRRCRVWTSAEFVAVLARVPGSARGGVDEPPRPSVLTPEQVRAWRKQFGLDDSQA